MEIPDAVKWYSKKLNFEFGSPHPPLKSYVNVHFTGEMDVSKSSYGFAQEPTEFWFWWHSGLAALFILKLY